MCRMDEKMSRLEDKFEEFSEKLDHMSWHRSVCPTASHQAYDLEDDPPGDKYDGSTDADIANIVFDIIGIEALHGADKPVDLLDEHRKSEVVMFSVEEDD